MYQKYFINSIFFTIVFILLVGCKQENPRQVIDFNQGWKFTLGDDSLAYQTGFDDTDWRQLDIPHDWSIEGEFSEEHKTGQAGGALPAGIGWYRKTFTLPEADQDKEIYIDIGGVYRNSEVWINGQHLGKRPFGYISFRYELTPYLKYGGEENVLAVKVDNSVQPNSRWYTGSGIYRDVELVKTSPVHVALWGTFITTPEVSEKSASVVVDVSLVNKLEKFTTGRLETTILNPDGAEVSVNEEELTFSDNEINIQQAFTVDVPKLWSVDNPALYKAVTRVYAGGELMDKYETTFGIRDFSFDAKKGFFLNGEPLKILGVNLHHDLGALGAAFNRRAAERQLEILKEMGCNGIRMAHNPPAAEMLDLCDEMGFIVMDEAFDVWAKKKAKKDYHLNWDEWHEQDLRDMVLRDRNHPSIFMWSIGNEIREQFDSSGLTITKELVDIVKSLDTTRLVTNALTENIPERNFIAMSGALDLLGFNYKHEAYADLPNRFPGQKFLASETSSAYATRGHYDMPSDSVQRWPAAHNEPIPNANPDFTVSAYDMISAYWGSTHEETWKEVKRLDHMAGIYVWSGFDYLGEPTPYPYPARSSYFGIIDLAGFPKDAYYMYKSEWSDDTVLHVFPHWNWEAGQEIDVWAYYNNADEVELFVNGESQGVKSKEEDDLHVQWRVNYQPGQIQVVSRRNGQEVASRKIETAGKPAQVRLTPDRNVIKPDGYDLSFVTVEILDENGNLVPYADNLVHFELSGPGRIAGVDNGYQASMESFKDNKRKAWKGKALVIVQSTGEEGEVLLKATSRNISGAEVAISMK